AILIDRRSRPSHGYRAVHCIARFEGKSIEIQVRSRLQHLWAEVSERLSDKVGIELKYGSGPDDLQRMLLAAARSVARYERLEASIARLAHDAESADREIRDLRKSLKNLRRTTVAHLKAL